MCWLCGGETQARGWSRDTLLPKTFTDHPQAAAPSSKSICQSCAALISGDTWRAYVAEHPGDERLARYHRPLPEPFATAHNIDGPRLHWGFRPPARIRVNQTLCVLPGEANHE